MKNVPQKKRKKRAQVLVEYIILLAMLSFMGILLFNVGRHRIFQVWEKMKDRIAPACAGCEPHD